MKTETNRCLSLTTVESIRERVYGDCIYQFENAHLSEREVESPTV